jgi:hypothetical protein
MKKYQFTIHASPSELGAMEGMVTTYPLSTIRREHFQGTLIDVFHRVQALKAELIADSKYEIGKGFSIDAMLLRCQRKPGGYDASRRARSEKFRKKIS